MKALRAVVQSDQRRLRDDQEVPNLVSFRPQMRSGQVRQDHRIKIGSLKSSSSKFISGEADEALLAQTQTPEGHDNVFVASPQQVVSPILNRPSSDKGYPW